MAAITAEDKMAWAAEHRGEFRNAKYCLQNYFHRNELYVRTAAIQNITTLQVGILAQHSSKYKHLIPSYLIFIAIWNFFFKVKL